MYKPRASVALHRSDRLDTVIDPSGIILLHFIRDEFYRCEALTDKELEGFST